MFDNGLLVTDWSLCGTGRDSVGPWTTKDSQWKDHAPNSSKDCSEPVQRIGEISFLAQCNLVTWIFRVYRLQSVCAHFRETVDFTYNHQFWVTLLQGDTSSLADPAVVDQLVETKRGNTRISKIWVHPRQICTHCVNLLKVHWQLELLVEGWHWNFPHHLLSNFKWMPEQVIQNGDSKWPVATIGSC